jgi:hypothetical protein
MNVKYIETEALLSLLEFMEKRGARGTAVSLEALLCWLEGQQQVTAPCCLELTLTRDKLQNSPSGVMLHPM